MLIPNNSTEYTVVSPTAEPYTILKGTSTALVPPRKIPPFISAYLLVQGGLVLSVRFNPDYLDFALLDEFKDWQIYAGCRNEFEKNEVIGCVADVKMKSEYSRYELKIKGKAYDAITRFTLYEKPSDTIRNELARMRRAGEFSDCANLSKIELVCN